MSTVKKNGLFCSTVTFIVRMAIVTACVYNLLIGVPFVGAQSAPPKSLKDVPVVEPPNLSDFVADKNAAIILGKALFWDMQVGSDGI